MTAARFLNTRIQRAPVLAPLVPRVLHLPLNPQATMGAPMVVTTMSGLTAMEYALPVHMDRRRAMVAGNAWATFTATRAQGARAGTSYLTIIVACVPDGPLSCRSSERCSLRWCAGSFIGIQTAKSIFQLLQYQ